MSHFNETVLEIDLRALAQNFGYLKSKIGPHTKIMGVVKAFAYGSDEVRIAEKLIALGADFLAVAFSHEGVDLRQAGIEAPILVFHPEPGNFDAIIRHRLTPSIYSKKTLNDFIALAQSEQMTDFPIHLNINTGLNRLGFDGADTAFITKKLAETRAVKAEGIYSHFAASEDRSEREFSLGQLDRFKTLSKAIIDELDYSPLRHMCNTSGILNYPEAHFDLVRAGIGLYGYGNSAAEDKNLKPVGRLKTLILQIHDIEKGETVGYNRKFLAQKPMRTATLPFGHADGLTRIYGGGKVSVFINGKPAPIIGNVCMDMVMVDVTGIDCKEGDDVIVFDKDHSAESIASAAGTISYELITAISQRVKRVIVG